MQIGGISSINSITPVFNPALVTKPAPALPSPTTAAAELGTPQTNTAPQPAAPTQARTAPAPRPRAGGDAAAAAAAASAASSASTVAQLIGVYSTTVGGQRYAGTVEETNGLYTVSVPNVPGATATGTSEMAAENNLGTVLDELV